MNSEVIFYKSDVIPYNRMIIKEFKRIEDNIDRE